MRLRHADASKPGFTRVRRGPGFSYVDTTGAALNDPAERKRIAALAIPPAWRDVWVSPDPRGHLQATGIDAAGRKQYLYHEAWRHQRDRQKFRDMETFARRLPRLRTQIDRALQGEVDLTRDQIAACAVRLLDIGLFRIGGERYADEDGGFGLATLTREQVSFIHGSAVFDYLGKSGVRRRHTISDAKLVPILQKLHRRRSEPDALLVFRDGRHWHPLGTAGITDYLKSLIGDEFSAKDFRTWNATVLAATLLAGSAASRPQRNRVIRRVVGEVSEILGNTPAVARRSYIDPRVIDRYLAGHTIEPALEHIGPLDEIGERQRRRLELAVLELLQ
jgi:DNA topoisomerase IB